MASTMESPDLEYSAGETPTLPAVAQPPHLFGVPMGGWLLAMLGACVAASMGTILLPLVTDRTLALELFLSVGIGLWIRCFLAYRRDPHIIAVWRALYVDAKPWPPRRTGRRKSILAGRLRGPGTIRFV